MMTTPAVRAEAAAAHAAKARADLYAAKEALVGAIWASPLTVEESRRLIEAVTTMYLASSKVGGATFTEGLEAGMEIARRFPRNS